jgi:hypothetical protein
MARIGVDQRFMPIGRLRKEPDVFRDTILTHSQNGDIAGASRRYRNAQEVARRSLKQIFGAARFGPVRRVGRDRFRLWPQDFSPDASQKPKAIGARVLQARLVTVGRSNPVPRSSDDQASAFCVSQL